MKEQKRPKSEQTTKMSLKYKKKNDTIALPLPYMKYLYLICCVAKSLANTSMACLVLANR